MLKLRLDGNCDCRDYDGDDDEDDDDDDEDKNDNECNSDDGNINYDNSVNKVDYYILDIIEDAVLNSSVLSTMLISEAHIIELA